MKTKKLTEGNTSFSSIYPFTGEEMNDINVSEYIKRRKEREAVVRNYMNNDHRTVRISGLSGNSMYGILSGGDLDLTIQTAPAQQPQRVTFVKENKKDVSAKLVDPVKPDINYPVKAFFNLEKLTTVLVFADGERVKVVADEPGKGKNAYNGVLIALTRRILGTGTSLSSFYDKYKSDSKTEVMFYGVVMGYFVSKGIVRDAETFDRWMVEFLTTRLTTHPQKK